jgi:hypothetical protein
LEKEVPADQEVHLVQSLSWATWATSN